MAIDVRLDHVLLDRRMTLTELSDRVGITLANLSILKTGKARAIRLSTLDAICRELDCQPGDLLIHVPDDGSRRGRQPQHQVSRPTSGSGIDSSSTASPRIVP